MDYPVRTSEQLGEVLKGIRRHKGISQLEAGRKVGFGQSAVSELEADPGRASVERLFRLLSALGLELLVRDRTERASARRRADEW